jgi:homoserine kinase
MKRVKAFGPAGLGNLAAGFDTLGAALLPVAVAAAAAPAALWGDLVEIVARDAGSGIALVCDGPFAHLLPPDSAQNLAIAACDSFARRLGRPLPACELRLHKGLPVGSGLGSSSATIVAVLRALDAFVGEPLGDARLLSAAGEAEARSGGAVILDNVAAALLGGLQLVDAAGGAHRLPFPEDLRFVVASPALTLTTRAARAVLPATVPFALAVAHAQNLAALVHALHAGDRALLRESLVDRLVEPSRAPLIPGFARVQEAARAAGAWGCSLSGAGPALFAVAEEAAAPAVGDAMRHAWGAAGIAAEVTICALDLQGARVLDDGACA